MLFPPLFRASRLMRMWWLAIVVGLVLGSGLGSTRAGAQAPTNLRVVQIDTVRPDQIEITVDYSLANGQPAPEDPTFRVSVDQLDLPVVQTRQIRLPVDVAIVADLSARMSDKGGPFTSRFIDMLPHIKNLISQLQSGANFGSLVVIQETIELVHPLGPDLQAIANTIERGNAAFIFEPQPLGGGSVSTPAPNSAEGSTAYPLAEAIQTALAQLAGSTGQIHPRALVIMAAGGPISPEALAQLNGQIDQARAERTPIRVVVLGFGSADPGTFVQYPAGTVDLRQLAETLDGTFIDLSNQLIDVARSQQITDEFTAIVRRGNHWVLTVDVSAMPVGANSVRISTGDAAVDTQLEVGALPPRFTVEAATAWQGPATMSILVQSAQAPIVRVEYQLNNYPLGESASAERDFALTIDPASRDFQANFPPGEYTLSAVAFDATGAQSAALTPLTITVLPPPPPEGIAGLIQSALGGPIWVFALILVVAGALFVWTLTRRRVRAQSSTDSFTASTTGGRPVDEEPTSRYGTDDQATTRFQVDDDRATRTLDEREVDAQLDDEKTARYNPTASPQPTRRWFLEVLEGAEYTRIELLPGQRHYDIGRPASNHRPHIPVPNPMVSRHHAKIELFRDDLELVALETENGTFFGEERRSLTPNERVPLSTGDVFWLSPRVKLRLESEPNR